MRRKLMPYMKVKLISGLVILLTVFGLVLASIWGFVVLASLLLADAGNHSQVGIHYAAPYRESKIGSRVSAGLRPIAPASSIDESVKVPYKAVYYFYRAED
jgi:hypothetical protein